MLLSPLAAKCEADGAKFLDKVAGSEVLELLALGARFMALHGTVARLRLSSLADRSIQGPGSVISTVAQGSNRSEIHPRRQGNHSLPRRARS